MRPTTKPSDPGAGRAAALLARRVAVADDSALRGRAACRALAAATDAWVAALLDEATGGDQTGLALVATGGYGRNELAPMSDLDVWLVHEGRHDVGAVAERLWYPVWDAGLKLGHAVRTPRQALALAGDDLDTATAALSLRLVAGDVAVVSGLAEQCRIRWRKRAGRWLDELHQRVVRRHGEAGEVAFLLEPDLKEGRGGLRDVHALRWADAARPVLQDGDDASLTEAEDVLLEVRVALHRSTGRPSELLLLERQDDVAAALDDHDADAVMARLATAARTVAWIGDEVWRRLAGPGRGVGRRFRRDRHVSRGVSIRDGEVHVEPMVDPAGEPTLLLRAALAAADADVPIHRPSLDRLAARAPALGDPWPDGAREVFVSLLATGHAAVPVLEALDQRGLVERVLPEWTTVRSRPQRNALHRFTVDRHLWETAANAAGLTTTVGRPDLLLVAALLHDLGKGSAGDHTEAGVALMGELAPRMGFPPDDAATLVALVRHHLLLPDVATRRDLDDDAVISGVAAAVGSLHVLELLAALTEADALATGPSAWGSWKAELVGELVRRAAHVLRGGDAGEVTAAGQFPGPELREVMAAGRVVVRADPPLVTVVAPDRPGLFSRIAGALTLRGVTVLAAEAGGADGMAASQFRVDEAATVDWDDVVADVRRAVDGRLALEARLAQRARPSRRAPAGLRLAGAPTVRVDNTASGTATVVEVHAPDRIGVLYRITRALADLDLDIQSAKVATLGHEVVDSFYVRTSTGAKITDRDHVREVERAILHQLSL